MKIVHLATAFALSVGLVACDDAREAEPRKTTKAVPVTANFTLDAFVASDSRDRAEAAATAKAEAEKIKQLIDGYYNVAFVQPPKWSNGQHPELAGFFAPEAQGGIAANLGGLALADIAPKISKVRIKEQKILKVTTLFEDDLAPSHAIADVSFTAIGQPKSKGAQPIDVVHTMTVWLRPEAGAWKIWSYSANLKADSRIKAAAWGPLASEAA